MKIISFTVPCYNSEQYMRKCIDSLLVGGQDVEIIIVNDGSTDNSLNMAKKVKEEFCNVNIIIISQENRGASAARNTGIKIAKGEYIQFLDADDIISSNKISEQIKILTQEKHSRNLIFCKCKKLSSDEILYENICKTYYNPISLLVDLMKNDASVYPHCYMLHRELINIAGLWDENVLVNNDGEFFSRIIAVANKVIYNNNHINKTKVL
jgi:glycosyltransferase involved in cell wall biosynthesis